MDCTGEANRIRICNEYDIEVIGCYKLFDGRRVISNAGRRIITDKYYLFKCTHKITSREESIKCGSEAASHICRLTGNSMPVEFNPFQEVNDGGGGAGGIGGQNWHQTRRQLHNAIMLFITRYGDRLQPDSTIFKIKARVESNFQNIVEERDVLAVNTILGSFHTTIPNILDDFSRTRAVRNFRFNALERMLLDKGVATNNFT